MARASNKSLKTFWKTARLPIHAFARLMRFYPTFQQAQLLDAVQDICDRLRAEVEPYLVMAKRAQRARRTDLEKEWNDKAIEAVAEITRRIAIRSGQGPGKTTCGCIVALWWVLQWPGARVILSAPKMQQCKDVFLAEMERVLDRGHPYVKKLLNIQNTQMGVMGRKPKVWGLVSITASEPDNARGQHGEYMMILVEEASGVEKALIEVFKGTLSNPLCLLVLIGNPSRRDSSFFDCFNVNAEQWLKLHWNGEETPASPWFNPSRNAELAEEFGRDSDVYRVAVLGEFPKIDGDCIMSEEDLLACTDVRLLGDAVRASDRRAFGLDVARFGGDELVWYRISGNAVASCKIMHRVDPSILLKDAMQEQETVAWRNENCRFIIDADGMGQGCVSQLYEAHRNVLEFHSNGTATKSFYANKITQAYFQLAKLVREHKVYIPYDRLLFKQLSTRKFGYSDQKGRESKLQIETKEKYKERTKMPSPDRADALVMAFYDEDFGAIASLDRGPSPGIMDRVIPGR